MGFFDALGETPPADVGRPCGVCRACRLIDKDAHPDVRIVAPEPGKRTLEEPPDDTVLLLTAADSSQVLPTIVSRCREVPLRTVPAGEIAAALVARGVGETEAGLLARLSGGRPGWAIAAAADPHKLDARTQHVAALEALVAQPRVVRLQAAGSFGDAAATKDLLDVWLGWWRDALLAQQGCEDLVANVDRLEPLRRLGAPHHAATLWRAMARVQEARQQIDANVNVRLAVEALLLDLPETSLT
jgi:DNA polymerase-3 subunit delta'